MLLLLLEATLHLRDKVFHVEGVALRPLKLHTLDPLAVFLPGRVNLELVLPLLLKPALHLRLNESKALLKLSKELEVLLRLGFSLSPLIVDHIAKELNIDVSLVEVTAASSITRWHRALADGK